MGPTQDRLRRTAARAEPATVVWPAVGIEIRIKPGEMKRVLLIGILLALLAPAAARASRLPLGVPVRWRLRHHRRRIRDQRAVSRVDEQKDSTGHLGAPANR
jgi:hypothetical protein